MRRPRRTVKQVRRLRNVMLDEDECALLEARRLVSQPIAVRPEWARELLAAVRSDDRAALRSILFGWGSAVASTEIVRGVGILQIRGPLVQGSYFTDYSDIRAGLDDLAATPGVHSILLDIDSPGGDVHAEQFALAERVREIRDAMPVWAIANEQATSAAYVIAAQASRVLVANANTSIVGSLGVIAMHVDWSDYDAKNGFSVTEIVTGRHKNELSPNRPLSRDGRATLEMLVEGAFAELISSVTAGRISLSEDAIRSQEAAIYLGAGAQEAGLIDGVSTRDDAVEALVELRLSPHRPALGGSMSENADHPAGAAPASEPGPSPVSGSPEPRLQEAGADALPAAGAEVIELDAERARLRGEERQAAREIVELCALAGMPGLASSLLAEEGMTRSRAAERIQEARIKASGPEISSAADVVASDATSRPRIDSAAVYRALNRREGE